LLRRVACLVIACAVIVTAGTGVSGRAVQHQQALVLDGAQVIDGTGAAPIPSARVVVEDGRIAAIGPMDRTPAAANGAGRFRCLSTMKAALLPAMGACWRLTSSR